MKFKLIASLVLAAGLASTVNAATTYTVGGTQSYSIDEVTGPGSALMGILTQNPSAPTFSGSWSINPVAPSLAGSFVFAPYSVHVDLSASVGGSVDLTIPARVLTLSGGSYSYDSATRTLSATGIDFLETSPGMACEDGGTSYCEAVPGPDSGSHGALMLTFAADMLSFTGVANVYQGVALLAMDHTGICYAEGGPNPCANNTLTFSGVAEVPVPAAAWLFGSGVLGLAGLKRRKAA